MNEITQPTYQEVATTLRSHGLASSPAEVHGLMTGMLCGGLPVNGVSWADPIADFANNGEPLSDGLKTELNLLFSATALELATDDICESLELSLLIPETDLFEQAEGLSDWVSSFLSGVGLMGLEPHQFPQSVKEAFSDLQDIAQLGIDEDEDFDLQGDLFEQVLDHVKMCVLTCYLELVIAKMSKE